MTLTAVALVILIAAVVLFGIACVSDEPWLWFRK